MNKNSKEKNDRTIIVYKEDGQAAEGKILFTFSENGDDYILYELDNKVYGAKIDQDNNLTPIEEDEWVLVEKIFNEFIEEYNQEEIEE